VTGSVIQAHDRIVYLNPAEKPHVFTITHAQIVVAVPPNVTDINDPRVIVDSRRGPDEILRFNGPGADRYHGPASGDGYTTKLFRVYRLKPCTCH